MMKKIIGFLVVVLFLNLIVTYGAFAYTNTPRHPIDNNSSSTADQFDDIRHKDDSKGLAVIIGLGVVCIGALVWYFVGPHGGDTTTTPTTEPEESEETKNSFNLNDIKVVIDNQIASSGELIIYSW